MALSSFDERTIIKAISFPLSLISISSTIFVFVLYLANRQLHFFPFRIIIYIQLSDFLLSLSQMFIFLEDDAIDESGFVCQFQAFLMQCGVLGTIFWSFILSSLMLASLRHQVQVLEEKEHILILFGFYLPGLIAVMFKTYYDY